MTEFKITCRVTATGPGLLLSAKIDDREFWRGDPCGSHDLAIDLSDDDGEHVIVFELSGKTAAHTIIDSAGEIIQDLTVSIVDLAFDGISQGHAASEQMTYEHDFNGTGDRIKEKFYGTMGCNGTVSLQFTTPIYLWLLENM